MSNGLVGIGSLLEAIAFDVFTAMRAYGCDQNPMVLPTVKHLHNVDRKHPDARSAVLANAPGLIQYMWRAISHKYLGIDPGFQLTKAHIDQAAPHLTDLILRYPLLDRMPPY